MRYQWRVVGKPEPQPRVKAARAGGFTRVYTPPKADSWKSLIALAIAQGQRPPEPIDGPVSLHLNFTVQRPGKHYRSNGTLKADAPTECPTKPDLDNLVKATMDAMSAAGVWSDDARVARLAASKTYTTTSGVCGLLIVVEEL